MFIVNVDLPFKLARSFGANWIQGGKRGKIISTGSLYSFVGGYSTIGYSASKGAIHSITQALSNDWAAKGINVNSIIPGYVETGMTEGLRQDPVIRRSLLIESSKEIRYTSRL